MSLTKYKLGELIKLEDERNSDEKYSLSDVKGISIQKIFIETKADMQDVSLKPYILVKPDFFAYVTVTSRNGEKITLAHNVTNNTYIVSSSYVVFSVSKPNLLNSDYLYMFFNRPEFDRYSRFNSWGSAREAFSWEDMCDIDIELPDIDTQQKYVDIYNAMVANQQSYEHGLNNLKLVCDAYIEKLKQNCSLVPISKVCYLSDIRNEDESCTNVKGLTVYKSFIDTKANMDGVSLKSYKLVECDDIAYVPTTNRNGDKIACGLAEEKCIVSSTYEVLKIDKKICSPHYLFMWFARTEMDRFARYNSWGSARETIEWTELGSYKIPLPSLQIQKAIASIYKVYWQRKKFNEQLKLEIKNICPILIKGSLEE